MSHDQSWLGPVAKSSGAAYRGCRNCRRRSRTSSCSVRIRYIVRIEQTYFPSSSSVAYTSAGGRSANRSSCSRARTCSRSSGGKARGTRRARRHPLRRLPPPVVGGPRDGQRLADRGHAQGALLFRDDRHQPFSPFRCSAIPRNSATFFWSVHQGLGPLRPSCLAGHLPFQGHHLGGQGVLRLRSGPPLLRGQARRVRPVRRCGRQVVKFEEYNPSRRSSAPSSPSRVHASASRRILSLYSAENRRRVALATTSTSFAIVPDTVTPFEALIPQSLPALYSKLLRRPLTADGCGSSLTSPPSALGARRTDPSPPVSGLPSPVRFTLTSPSDERYRRARRLNGVPRRLTWREQRCRLESFWCASLRALWG